MLKDKIRAGTRISLRWQFLFVIGAIFFVSSVATLLAVYATVHGVAMQLSAQIAQRQVRYDRERIRAPLNREIALVELMARMPSIHDWLSDESDVVKRRLAVGDLKKFRDIFADHSYFIINNGTLHYYFGDSTDSDFDLRPRYTLRKTESSDAWYFAARSVRAPYDLNVAADSGLGVTKVWVNKRVFDRQGRLLGLVGTGLDLTTFIRDILQRDARDTSNMLLDADANIIAYQDASDIETNSAYVQPARRHTLFSMLDADGATEIQTALAALKREPEGIRIVRANSGARAKLFAIMYVPELHWYVASVMDSHRLVDVGRFSNIFLVVSGALVTILLVTTVTVGRFVVRPLRRLALATTKLSRGSYDLELPSGNRGELATLTDQFGVMASEIRRTLTHLEQRVAERTSELASSNAALSAQQEEIQASLRYAAQVQEALLPGPEQMRLLLGGTYCAVWAPQTLVGGDFYFCLPKDDAIYTGVGDCAGHGVPAALMSVMVQTVLRQVLLGPEGDASLPLDRIVRHIESFLGFTPGVRSARMDYGVELGVCRLRPGARTFEFVGRGLDLYYCDASGVGCIMGGQTALGQTMRRGHAPAVVRQVELSAGMVVYLSSDGLFDQPGGQHGLAFGRERFEALISGLSGTPLDEQPGMIRRILDEYRGTETQRDDITVLAFEPGVVIQSRSNSYERA